MLYTTCYYYLDIVPSFGYSAWIFILTARPTFISLSVGQTNKPTLTVGLFFCYFRTVFDHQRSHPNHQTSYLPYQAQAQAPHRQFLSDAH